MAGNYSYDRLPTLQESQDIADVNDALHEPQRAASIESQHTLRPRTSTVSLPPYSDLEKRDAGDHASIHSFDTFVSSSSSSTNIEKLKSGWKRISRKPIPRYLQGSIRRHPAAEIEPTRIARGLWKDQLLSDRSLRGMAVLTTVLAIAMLILVIAKIKPFRDRANKFTTSVGGETQDCKTVTRTNTALLLIVNIAATMVLGMSNTYQQLCTSLNIGDLKHMLSKFGDSRVGTNSPFNIRHKQEGKTKAWLSWLLLISTSMPVHFLANSLLGPSYIIEPPSTVVYNETTYGDISYIQYSANLNYISSQGSFVCWSAFRTGAAHFPKSISVLAEDDSDILGAGLDKFGTIYSKIIVEYVNENCTGLANDTSTSDIARLEASVKRDKYDDMYFGEGNCEMGTQVKCLVDDTEPAKCRLNVRMNAAFILMSCLIVKAMYMVAINLVSRGKRKQHCLTFGDILVASASNPELRVQGECMVNGGDSFRRKVTHTCHKHCKSKEESKTGDEIGHCQKCKKWNSINKLSALPQPTIATKIKKSLITNLGNIALTQMCLLMFCSLFMLFASIAVSVGIGSQFQYDESECRRNRHSEDFCNQTSLHHFNEISGGWGGFNQSLTAATLPADQLTNELLSFCISNGAQFIYSLLYLMLIYNITLISQEYDWGQLEWKRGRLRTTIVKGDCFSQDYLLQLPRKILFPIMIYSVLTHWMLGEALQTQEAVWMDHMDGRNVEHSKYIITYAAYPLWTATLLILVMTGICWWAFTYKREGFIPQMFGSIRTLCSATTQLDEFPEAGILWGDLGMGKQFRHAGLSSEVVGSIVPHELYAGTGNDEAAAVEGEASTNDLNREKEAGLIRKRAAREEIDEDLDMETASRQL